ncbi:MULTISPECIES: hypothetical protein [unclassified Pedobacter]|uniref:hypothetical protein n=1 Tax=unclassified Pedobacter TaxID=2628915 RepID=UPI001E399D2C|nr:MULTISPECIES: hypothetical protein [unclassified Pedobacter]
MKNVILTISLSFLIIACKTQKPLAKMDEGKINISGETYLIKKPDHKRTQLVNTSNKFSKVRFYAPNLPQDIKINSYIKFDKKIVTQICAKYIPLSILEQLPKGFNDFLFIGFKMNENGSPIEIEFLMKNTSLLTLSQLKEIEEELKAGKFKVVIQPEIKQFLKGINYFEVDIPVLYSDMLKSKQEKF